MKNIHVLPKEEPKQELPIINGSYGCIIQTKKQESKQETLEEAAEKYVNKKGDISTTELEDAIFKQGFIDGANWQQEQICTSEFIQRIRATKLDAEARRLIIKTFKG